MIKLGFDHFCCLAPLKEKPDSFLSPDQAKEAGVPPTPFYIFYDFETAQNNILDETETRTLNSHQVLLAMALKTCRHCYKTLKITNDCKGCGEVQFMGPNALDAFARWLFSPENRGAKAFAHNFSGFDGQFLMKWLIEQGHETPEVIMKGLKVIQLKACGLTLLDSYLFLSQPLSSLPKAFGLEEVKGTFPYLTLTLENLGMKQQGLPPIEDYCFDHLKPAARDKMKAWYEEHRQDYFDLDAEMVRYCEFSEPYYFLCLENYFIDFPGRADVKIMAQSLMIFRELFIKTMSVDPFSYCTIAACSMAGFRTLFLKPNEMGLTPLAGYDFR